MNLGGEEGNKDRCQQMCLSNTLGMEKTSALQNCCSEHKGDELFQLGRRPSKEKLGAIRRAVSSRTG